MPIISPSSGLSLKVAVVSTCVLSVGVMMLKHYSVLPLVPDVLSFWNILSQWLKPPYLYIVINGIIVSIVACSKLQQKDNDDHHQYYPSPYNQISVQSPEEKAIIPSEVSVYDHHHHYHVQDLSENKKMVGDLIMDGGDVVAEVEKHVTTPSLLQRNDSMEFSSDSYGKENKGKPPVSARFGQRKAVKASPEGGKALRVSKSKRSDTLESTWKTITEGRAMPLTRHLKKSDTWESHVRQHTPPSSAPKLKKPETFNKHSSNDNANAYSGRLKRESSPSQDELNRRVEAFIKKFNEEMRLQRQRSLEQYNQMINRGAN